LDVLDASDQRANRDCKTGNKGDEEGLLQYRHISLKNEDWLHLTCVPFLG
jgi:hypothetical protein